MNAPLILPTTMLSALEAAYVTPPRAYHDFRHVQEVLRHFAEVSAGPGWAQPAEVYLAALYHDAIYEAGRKVSAAGVYFVFAAVTANAYYNVLVYRHVRANNLVHKNVHNVRVFYNQRVLPFVRRAYQLALPHGVPFRF